MSGVRRRVVVTAILALFGFLSGAMLGAVVMAANLVIATGQLLRWDAGLAIAGSAVLSGTLGAVLGPAGGWLLLRHVPLGRAIACTALGTLAGAVLGFALQRYLPASVPWPPLTLGVLGFLVAAICLRLIHRVRDQVVGLDGTPVARQQAALTSVPSVTVGSKARVRADPAIEPPDR